MSAATSPSNASNNGQDGGQGPTVSNWVLLRRLLGLGWRYRRGCVGVISLQVMLVLFSLGALSLAGIGIDFIRHTIDPAAPAPRWPFGLKPPGDWSAMHTVAAVAAGVLIAAVLHAVVRFAHTLAVAKLIHRIIINLRTDVYDKMQRLSFRFFDASDSGSLINRVTGDVQAVRRFVDGVVIQVITVVLSLAIYLSYMMSIHVGLTLACLATTPLLWALAVRFARKVKPAYRHNRELVDATIRKVSENIKGQHVVKCFGRQPEQIAQFREANAAVHDQKTWIFRQVARLVPTISLLTQVNMLVLLGYGGWLVIHGRIPLGEGLVVFAGLLHQLSLMIGQVANITNTVQMSLIGAQRVFEVLDEPIEIESRADAVRLPITEGVGRRVTFEHVTFSYGGSREGEAPAEPGAIADRGIRGASGNGSGRQSRPDGSAGASPSHGASPSLDPVLHDITFEAEPGQCVAILGPTGAGKSTLLSLVCRFYDPTRGRVLIDGHDVRTLDLDDLRRNVGLVFQESFLFSNTVAANVAFGHPEATREQVEKAVRIAAAEEFVANLPQSYDTVIGENGIDLSGGQRQRLAIARAILLEPSILILDDATASIDPQTEEDVLAAMDQAMRGRTTFVVAHRLSTLRRADVVIVLDKGRIVQMGRHEELMAASGTYRRTAELQIADEESRALLECGPVT